MNTEAIFTEALEKHSSQERAKYLDTACGDDQELRARVEALLNAHDRPDSFLMHPLLETSRTSPAEMLRASTGTRIGNYLLLEVIGEGGFGVVYMAEQQDPVQRRVALKIIKPGMDSTQVLARFEAERQALARMDHPNIAKILDAGATPHGRPYFVMELIKGPPITQYCDQHQLTLESRLDLFTHVCHAIQHAHQKGVIHRDIKPSNVLVCHYDGEPVPKVIDFGVAKAIEGRLTNKPLFTHFGQIIGTFEYMSPEQAELSQLDLDTRSDIYSLGTLLYELLTGTTPFDARRLSNAAFDELRRVLREEIPPPPSRRISTLDKAPSILTNRGTGPERLASSLRGELDWIVMKTLEKQRSRRYETVTDLTRDIQRYLKGEPIEARPSSKIYAFRKFVARHATVVIVAAAVLICLCLGILGTSIGLVRARKEMERARSATAESMRQRDYAQGLASRNLRLAKSERDALQAKEDQLHQAQAQRLAAQSLATRPEFPVRGLLLARESVRATWLRDQTVMPVAHELLLNSLAVFGGQPLVGHTSSVQVVAISPDDRWLVTGGFDQTVRLWDLTRVDSARSIRVLTGHRGFITAACISPDSQWLVTCSSTYFPDAVGDAFLWNLTAPDPSQTALRLPHDRGVSAAAISGDGRWLVTACCNGTMTRWDLAAPDPTAAPTPLQVEDESFHCVAIDRHGERIAASSGKTSVRLFELDTNGLAAEPRNLSGLEGSATFITFSLNDRWLVTTGIGDRSPRFWDLHRDDLTHTIGPPTASHKQPITAMTRSPDGRWLVTGSMDHTARLWDLTLDQPAHSSLVMWGHHTEVSATSVSPDSRWLATGSGDGIVHVWNLSSADPSARSFELRGHEGSIRDIAFSHDSRILVTSAADSIPRLWSFAKDQPIQSPMTLKESPAIELVASPRGDWLATGSVNGSLFLWDTRPGQVTFDPVAELSPHDVGGYPRGAGTNVTSIAFSPDGNWRAAASFDTQSAHIWKLATGKPPVDQRILPHDAPVHAVAFTHDSRWLLTASGVERGPESKTRGEGQVQRWDLHHEHPESSSDLLGKLDVPARLLVTSFDGRWVAAAGQEGQAISLWDLQSEDPRASHFNLPLPDGAGVLAMAMSPSDEWLAVGCADGSLLVWPRQDLRDGTQATRLAKETASILLLTWSPDDRWLVAGGEDGVLRAWDFRSHAPAVTAKTLQGHEGKVISGALRADSRYLATAAWGEPARIWDLNADDPTSTVVVLRSQIQVAHVAFCPRSDWLATAGLFTTQLWDLDVESLLRRAELAAGRELTESELQQYQLIELSTKPRKQ